MDSEMISELETPRRVNIKSPIKTSSFKNKRSASQTKDEVKNKIEEDKNEELRFPQ